MKKALVVVAILVLVAGGAALWLYYSLDVLVKLALEQYGPRVTGVAVHVEGVKISPRDGIGSVEGLEIGNAYGFSAPRAARFGEIRVAVDPLTLREKVVRIHELAVESAAITYERGDRGTNLEAIRKNIEEYVKRSAEPSPAGGPSEARSAKRRFIVERLTIRGARVTMTNPALHGQGITFDLPDVTLRDVGKREGGATASEVANVVANTLLERISQKVLTNIDLLRKGGVQGAVDALKGLLR